MRTHQQDNVVHVRFPWQTRYRPHTVGFDGVVIGLFIALLTSVGVADALSRVVM